jgi:hypothetical protein
MTDLVPVVTVGSDILDIGTRKARRQRGDPMDPSVSSSMMMGLPGQFDVPNVSNVCSYFDFMGSCGIL